MSLEHHVFPSLGACVMPLVTQCLRVCPLANAVLMQVGAIAPPLSQRASPHTGSRDIVVSTDVLLYRMAALAFRYAQRRHEAYWDSSNDIQAVLFRKVRDLGNEAPCSPKSSERAQ